jgi:acyl-coenzyme A synthetase/AMP-(fatty) acid ligase
MPLRERFVPLSQLLSTGRADGLAVCADGARSVTWREFVLQVGAIARALRPRAQRRWLVHCEHPLNFAAALLALLHEGRTAVVAPGLQPATVELLRPAYEAVLGDGAQPLIDLRSLAAAAVEFRPIDARAARIELYTSGSSAEPKCVPKTLHQLETEARGLEALWGSSLGGAALVATVPHHHIYGLLFRLIWPLAAARRFDAALCADPELLIARLEHHGDAALVSSPAHLTRLPQLLALERLKACTRRIFSSGGPLPAQLGAEYQRRLGAAPTEVYGSTESGGIAWREQDGSDESAAWRPFPAIELASDAQGALSLRSPYLADDGWLVMGDAAELLPDGRFRLKGRLDRVVKVEGKRVSLPELEHALRQHPWVCEAAVVPLAGSKQSLGAVVILREPGRAGAGRQRLVAALREHLLSRFERVLVPRHWRFVPQLPTDERGKLPAGALRQLFHKAEDAPAA